jgi:hypothetical protein
MIKSDISGIYEPYHQLQMQNHDLATFLITYVVNHVGTYLDNNTLFLIYVTTI